LQPIAQQNSQIKSYIDQILSFPAVNSQQNGKQPIQLEPSRENSPAHHIGKWDNPMAFMTHLLIHYLGNTGDTAQLLAKLTKQCNTLKTFDDLCKCAYETVKKKLEADGIDKPMLMAVLEYLCTESGNKILIAWYHAIVLFATERDCKERDEKILDSLQDALLWPLVSYTAEVKQKLIFDHEFSEFLEKLATHNEAASLILRRFNIIKQKDPMEAIDGALLNTLETAHDKGNVTASIWLAESLLHGQQNQNHESVQKAFLILNRITETKKRFNRAVVQQLGNLLHIAEQHRDWVTAMYAYYLTIIQFTYKNENDDPDFYDENNMMVIIGSLQSAEAYIPYISDDQARKFVEKLLKTSGTYTALLPLAANKPMLAKALGDLIGQRISEYGHSSSDYPIGIAMATRACHAPVSQFEQLFVENKQIIHYYSTVASSQTS